MPITLINPTSSEWLNQVLDNFDEFLLDHAANERKASSMAMSMVAHYPDKPKLVAAMIDLALEELNHFRQVFRLSCERGLKLADDQKDPYVNDLHKHMRRQSKKTKQSAGWGQDTLKKCQGTATQRTKELMQLLTLKHTRAIRQCTESI